MEDGKLSRCIICNSYTSKRHCYNIFTTTLDRGDILLSNFLKNVLGCSVLIIVPPDFFLCKKCYTLCSELDYSLDRCNVLQKKIQSLFKVTKANQEALELGSEPVEVKYEPDEYEEFYGNQDYVEEDNFEEEVEDNQDGETVEDIEAYLAAQLKSENNDEDTTDPAENETELVYENGTELVYENGTELVDESTTEPGDDIEPGQLIEDGVFWAPSTHFYEEELPRETLDHDNVEEVETGDPMSEVEIRTSEASQPVENEVLPSTQVLITSPTEEEEIEETSDPLGMVWFCKPCKIKFKSFEALKRHKKSATCKSSSKNFGIKSAYEYKNYTIKLKKKKKVFFCNYCTFEAPSAEVMDKHVKTHKSDPPLMCDVCGRRFKTSSTFKRHQKVHDESRPFACKLCTFRSETELTLRIHQRLHDDQYRFCCSKCNYSSVKKLSYQNHLRTHTGERPYCCPDCPYRAKDSSTLIRHRRTHGGLKRYHCTLCDYKALQKNSLKRHMMIHTGEKPHTCPHCDYSSTMRHNLADHIAAKHSTEKPFACNLCSYKAKAKRLLKYHMRIHSGEKPFACTQCDFRVRHRTSLAYHMRTRHPPQGAPQKVILKFVHFAGDNIMFSDDEEEDYEIDVSTIDE